MPSQGVVLGLSKVARLVTMFARRLQTQERFTQELLAAFEAEVLPQGCSVVVEAQQLEYGGRADVVISTARGGCFLQDHVMQEFLALLRLSGQVPSQSTPPATTSGLQECMEEAHCAPVPHVLEDAVLSILREIGEDPNREGLQGSAGRYVKFLLASTAGYRQLPQAGIQAACQAGDVYPVESPGMSAPEELHLHFMSHCEHHMLPFHGALHVAYVPGQSGQRVSPEALQSLLRAYSRRLQIQERLTQQVADAVHRMTGATSTLVVCEASHMCMVARGVEKHASSTVTMGARGACQHDAALRSSLLQQLTQ
ncbi:g10366 [Coccomyxa elongata]